MNVYQLKEEIDAMTRKEAKDLTPAEVKTVKGVIDLLNQGKIRVASCEKGGEWVTHGWIKEAILFYFRLMPMEKTTVGPFHYHDKIPLKKNFAETHVRVVPPATARHGSFMEEQVVLMPSYVNIGAYIGKGTMVDTWATVGSCAQIGARVHLSGGVGIGGVLEPVGAHPVIVEDGAFIGSRAIVVEGVRVGQGAVVAANCTLTASTPIIDTRDSSHRKTKGVIPPQAVVVPGTLEKNLGAGKIYTSCVYIIGERKKSTDEKTSLNNTLREFNLSV